MQGRNSKDVVAVIGKGVKVEGTINAIGVLMIDGEVEGRVLVEGTVILGEKAIIKAEIAADNIVIAGRSTGSIRAKEKIHLLSSGNHTGPMASQSLVAEEGSVWNGSSMMMERDNATSS